MGGSRKKLRHASDRGRLRANTVILKMLNRQKTEYGETCCQGMLYLVCKNFANAPVSAKEQASNNARIVQASNNCPLMQTKFGQPLQLNTHNRGFCSLMATKQLANRRQSAKKVKPARKKSPAPLEILKHTSLKSASLKRGRPALLTGRGSKILTNERYTPWTWRLSIWRACEDQPHNPRACSGNSTQACAEVNRAGLEEIDLRRCS